MSGKGGFKNPLASGLGKGGKVGAWVVAIGAVAAWNYYENLSNGEEFTKDELKTWNTGKKGDSKDTK